MTVTQIGPRSRATTEDRRVQEVIGILHGLPVYIRDSGGKVEAMEKNLVSAFGWMDKGAHADEIRAVAAGIVERENAGTASAIYYGNAVKAFQSAINELTEITKVIPEGNPEYDNIVNRAIRVVSDMSEPARERQQSPSGSMELVRKASRI